MSLSDIPEIVGFVCLVYLVLWATYVTFKDM